MLESFILDTTGYWMEALPVFSVWIDAWTEVDETVPEEDELSGVKAASVVGGSVSFSTAAVVCKVAISMGSLFFAAAQCHGAQSRYNKKLLFFHGFLLCSSFAGVLEKSGIIRDFLFLHYT